MICVKSGGLEPQREQGLLDQIERRRHGPVPSKMRSSARQIAGLRNIDRTACCARLSIRDIVLIDRLDIDFADGLAVLTGETGAGKSILLDAFALALGGRGDAGLVRHGAEQGQVTAVFDVPTGHPAARRS